MKLHLGCGKEIKAGFINIDFSGESWEREGTQYIAHDLTSGLPEVDLLGHRIEPSLIISCHVFEHFTDDQALELIKNCYKKMVQGGIFRIALPNFRNIVKAYLENDWNYANLRNWNDFSNQPTRTFIDFVSDCAYQRDALSQHQHKSLWDVEKTIKILDYIGFKHCREVLYNIEYEPDWDLRKRYSFVVSGEKC